MTAVVALLAGIAIGVLARSELARRTRARARREQALSEEQLDELLGQYGWGGCP